jgi:tRNA pseudouridine38-40 synthase
VGQRSVQEDLERAAQAIYGRPVPVYLAGRTDRGVHAVGQVASFADYRPGFPGQRLVAAFNDHLADDIAILEAGREPLGFHARYSAQWREYRYRIWSGPRQPLAQGFAWFQRGQLDLDRMRESAARLVGEHDFSSFASGGEGVPWSERPEGGRGTIRRIYDCDAEVRQSWWGAGPEIGELVEIRVVANGFLPRMVRGIAGTLVDAGRSKLGPGDIERLLEQRDRRAAPGNAPPDGLVLWAIGYEANDRHR